MILQDLLGCLAATLTTAAFVPQALLTLRTRSAEGVSLRMYALFTVGVDTCKGLIASRLKITERGTGFLHLPLPHDTKDGEYRYGVDEEFLAQLTAEKLITKHRGGVPHRIWIKTRPRNEALDLMVYAIAALRLLRPDLPALAGKLDPTRKPPPVEPAPQKPRWIAPRKPGGWLKGRR